MKIDDKSLMMIFLLETCNLSCIHCGNEDAPMAPGYRLSLQQLRTCLSDCRKLGSIRWVHFTGGEPTLWKEKNLHLVDLLLEISKAGFTPGFTSNGSFFSDYRRCYRFFSKYLDNSNTPVRIYFSIDTFHGNFDAEEERADSLDNIIRLRHELPGGKADMLDVRVMAVISRDPGSLLPDGMTRYYESQGITFDFLPLLPCGRASSIVHLCPDLDSDKPEHLGAYQRFHEKRSQEKQGKAKNRRRADFMNLIGNDYYFTNPWRKVAQLNNLPDAIIEAYSNPAGD